MIYFKNVNKNFDKYIKDKKETKYKNLEGRSHHFKLHYFDMTF